DARCFGAGVGLQVLFVGAIVDMATQVLVHQNQLVDAGTALVAVLIAGLATHRVIKPNVLRIVRYAEKMTLAFIRSVGLAAIRAEDSNQALGEEADQARGDQEGL